MKDTLRSLLSLSSNPDGCVAGGRDSFKTATATALVLMAANKKVEDLTRKMDGLPMVSKQNNNIYIWEGPISRNEVFESIVKLLDL